MPATSVAGRPASARREFSYLGRLIFRQAATLDATQRRARTLSVSTTDEPRCGSDDERRFALAAARERLLERRRGIPDVSGAARSFAFRDERAAIDGGRPCLGRLIRAEDAQKTDDVGLIPAIGGRML